MKSALGDGTIRQIIFDHYQEIISDDKKRQFKHNKTLALRQIEDKITKKERFRFDKIKHSIKKGAEINRSQTPTPNLLSITK